MGNLLAMKNIFNFMLKRKQAKPVAQSLVVTIVKSSFVLVGLIIVALSAWVNSASADLPPSESRVALVIGNSNYEVGALVNADDDARLMQRTLTSLGFNVTTLIDADQRAMDEAIQGFGKKLDASDVGLFYYAGHAVQSQGANFMIPTIQEGGLNRMEEADLKYKTVDLGQVIARMEKATNAVNIVIMDACRDNPLKSSSRSLSRGLAPPQTAARGLYIAYSTAPGDVALDGNRNAGNSPYTQSLAKHLKTPGKSINDVFQEVRKDVLASTNNRQTSWENSSLTDYFYFAGEQSPRELAELEKFESEIQQLKQEQENTHILEQQLNEMKLKLELANQQLANNSSTQENSEQTEISNQQLAKLNAEKQQELARVTKAKALARQKRVRQITKFVAKCDSMLNRFKDSPKILDCYQEVLTEMDSENERALTGVAKFKQNYYLSMSNAIDSGRLGTAKRNVQLAQSNFPEMAKELNQKISSLEVQKSIEREQNQQKPKVIPTF